MTTSISSSSPLVPALLLLLLPSLISAACRTSADCSLNGDCVSGVCACDAAWSSSPACDVLAVLPADPNAYHSASNASWGGNVVCDGNGTYHLFVAQMVNECGLESWGSNSAIVRAEGPTPAGPFSYKQTVRAHFGHNPTIRRLPDGGGFVIYFIGGGGDPTKPTSTAKDCRRNASGGAGGAGGAIGTGGATTAPIGATRETASSSSADNTSGARGLVGGAIHVIYSASLRGPWSNATQVKFDDGNSTAWNGGGSNPSPHIGPDGTVTLALQRQFTANKGKELIGVARAASWRGPFTMITTAPIEPEKFYCVAGTGEDPFLWKTRRGWHILWHGMCPTGFLQAHYAFSPDAVTWTVSPKQTYGYLTKFTDGSSKLLARVERPQLYFPGPFNDTVAPPTHLYNGACTGGSVTKIYRCLELPSDGKGSIMTWTLVRPLKG